MKKGIFTVVTNINSRGAIILSKYVVEMKDINKSFPNVKAIDNGEFNLFPGEIHSLIGENGAGKSTMMKILYGIYSPDSGIFHIKEQEFKSITPKQAIECGIGMVHQEFMLVNQMTVLENIILGFEPRKKFNIDFAEAENKINHYIEKYGMDIQPTKKISQISVGEAQRVEIIKTLYRGANILILDEPTAVLTPQETVKLFEILNTLKNSGKSIVFISHKLNEVLEISDRITVMRQGKFVGRVDKSEVTIPHLAKMMVGRDVFLNVEKKDAKEGDVVLSVNDVWISGEKELSKIRGLTFDVHSGEVVGIAGIDGNGQSELIEAITGLRKIEKGNVYLNDKPIENISPYKVRKAGISHIPEDRNVRGLNRQFTIMENLIGIKYLDKPYAKGIVQNKHEIMRYSKELIEKYDIRPGRSEILASSLSGGNAQKVILAREVDANTNLLIASQPSRGVDVGSIESIRKILNKAKEQGTAILLVSADLEEILSLSDRIVVMYEGKITGIINAKDANEDNIGLLMTGGEIRQ